MADTPVTVENAAEKEDLSNASRSELLARIEQLKRALADSRMARKAREVGTQMDQDVHQRPYPYIAGAAAIGALSGLVLGMLISRRHD